MEPFRRKPDSIIASAKPLEHRIRVRTRTENRMPCDRDYTNIAGIGIMHYGTRRSSEEVLGGVEGCPIYIPKRDDQGRTFEKYTTQSTIAFRLAARR